MNKKIITLAIISILLLSISIILIPIIVIASNKISIPIYVPPSDEEVQELLISRKKQFLSDFANGLIETPLTYSSLSSSEIESMKKSQAKLKEREDLIISTINKFYPNQLSSILQKISNEDIVYYNSASEAQKELYRLVLDVISNKDLIEDEKNILKGFLDSMYSNINDDVELQACFDNVIL